MKRLLVLMMIIMSCTLSARGFRSSRVRMSRSRSFSRPSKSRSFTRKKSGYTSKQRGSRSSRRKAMSKIKPKNRKVYNKRVTVVNKHYHTKNSYYGGRRNFYHGYHSPYYGTSYYRSSFGMYDTVWLLYMLDNMESNREMRMWYYSNRDGMDEFRNSKLINENAELKAKLAKADEYSLEMKNDGVKTDKKVSVSGSEFSMSNELINDNYSEKEYNTNLQEQSGAFLRFIILLASFIAIIFFIAVIEIILEEI